MNLRQFKLNSKLVETPFASTGEIQFKSNMWVSDIRFFAQF